MLKLIPYQYIERAVFFNDTEYFKVWLCLIYIIDPDTILNIQMSGNADILPGLRTPGVSRRTFDWVAKNEGLDECIHQVDLTFLKCHMTVTYIQAT